MKIKLALRIWSLIRIIMEEECPICNLPFDSDFIVPVMLCPQQHLCCRHCANQLAKHSVHLTCPECRQVIKKENIVKFRWFQKWEEKLNKIKIELEERANYQKKIMHESFKDEKFNLIKEVLHGDHRTKGEYLRSSAKERASSLMKSKNFDAAISLLSAIISRQFNSDEQMFLGLGSREQEQQFCQSCSYQWYEQRYSGINLSLEDILAIAYLKHPNQKQQRLWFEARLSKDPNNFKFIFGLALTEHNFNHTDAALSLYERTIEVNPNFAKAYQMIAFIKLDNKQYESALSYANKCLAYSPNNMFSLFIRIISDKSASNLTILNKLDQILRVEPKFHRARNMHKLYQSKNLIKRTDIARKIVLNYLQTSKQTLSHEQKIGKSMFLDKICEVSKKHFQSLLSRSGKLYDYKMSSYFLGVIEYILKNYSSSLQYFETYCEKTEMKGDLTYLLLCAISQLALKRYDMIGVIISTYESLCDPDVKMYGVSLKIMMECMRAIGSQQEFLLLEEKLMKRRQEGRRSKQEELEEDLMRQVDEAL